MNLTYQSASGTSPAQLALSGTADLKFGSGFDLSLDLGTSSSPGLLIQNGSLTTLNATASLDTTLAGATFKATGLGVNYVDRSGCSRSPATADLNFPDGPDLGLTLGTPAASRPGLQRRVAQQPQRHRQL